jgi:hypothetical protein
MISPKNVLSKFIYSSITLVNGPANGTTPHQGQPPQKKPSRPDPQQEVKLKNLQRKKDILLKPIKKQEELIQQQIQQQQKRAAPDPALDPNNDPADLYGQIRPLLSKMGLQNSVINNKTQLMIGQTEGKNSLYCVYLRRQESLTPDMISRIKRNESNFKEMKWTAEAISIYLWYPYVAETTAPVAPPAGAPGTI